MSPDWNPLHWGRPKNDSELTEYGRQIGYVESAKSSADIEHDKNLGLDLELIHDRELEEYFKNLIFVRTLVVDDKGKPVLNEDKEPTYNLAIDPSMLAVREIQSHLNSVSHFTEKEAEIQRNYHETVMLFVELGWGKEALFMALEASGRRRIAESIEGRKIKALKVIRKATAVEVSQRNSKGEHLV